MRSLGTGGRRGRRVALLGALGVAALLGAPPAGGADARVAEELYYRWSLGGYKGLLARLVIPGSGEAVLRTTIAAGERRIHQLEITSPSSRRGEFWRYGSEVEGADCRLLVRAWTEQYFRGRAKERSAELGEVGLLDIPSCICRIRRDPSERAIFTRIWSDGRIYPIRISGPETGEALLDGRTVPTRTYEVTGVQRPDERVWKGRLVLVVAMDERRTPLEIALAQPGLKVQLVLAEGRRGDAADAGGLD